MGTGTAEAFAGVLAIEMTVDGRPRSQPRPRWSTRHRRMFTPPNANAWKAAVRAACRQLVPSGVLWPDGPVQIELTFRLPGKPPLRWHTGVPDLDNLEKAVLDAITQSGRIWRDDCQVVVLRSAKLVSHRDFAGCRIRVSRAPAALLW